jgi:hypothetical protein
VPVHAPVHVEIDLNPGSEPMSGLFRSESGAVLEFTGVLELIGLIDAQMEESCEQE